MKIALPVALLAFVLGSVAGVLFERRRHAEVAPPVAGGAVADAAAATPAPDADKRVAEAEKKAADAAAELDKAKKRIAKLEAAGGTKTGKDGKKVLTPEEAKARMEELKARIPELVEKKDGKALIKLMQDLAELGEVGYLAAIEVSGIISADVQGGKNELGLTQKEFYKAFGGPMVPVLVWAMGKGDEVPAGFRAGAAYSLPWQDGVDAGRIFLDALKSEKNADVLNAISQNLDEAAKAGMEGELASLVPGYADNPRMLASLMDSLVKIGSDEAIASLDLFARSASDTVRAEAEVAMIAVRPPAEGILITLTVPNSQAENVGIKRGDIITSYNGQTVTDFDALREQMKSVPSGQVVTVTVNRKGEIIPLQIKGGAKIGIDGKDVKPK